MRLENIILFFNIQLSTCIHCLHDKIAIILQLENCFWKQKHGWIVDEKAL